MCLLRFENNLLFIEGVRFASKIILSLSIVFASLRKIICVLSEVFASLLKQFSYYRTCSLRFENNFGSIECVRFAWKIICLLSKVFASLRYRRKHHYQSFLSLSFCQRCHYQNGQDPNKTFLSNNRVGISSRYTAPCKVH